MVVVYILIALGILISALMSLLSHRLLISALWLAGASALTALLLYLLGTPEIAVVELSVGAGLVTVLFVFAINIAGEEPIPVKSLIPKPLAWIFLIITGFLLGYLIFPSLTGLEPTEAASGFMTDLWQYRQIDVVLQVVLIFSGALGVLGLLADEVPQHQNEEKPS